MRRFLLAVLPLAALAAGAVPACPATLEVLHAFCQDSACNDGAQPLDGLIAGDGGHFFGVTLSAGKHGHTAQGGTIFEMIPEPGGTWKEKVIHAFCARPRCHDGEAPDGPLVMDVAGSLYGVATTGGKNDGLGGVAFRLTPDATHTHWTYKVLYRFCSLGGGDCTDGAEPVGGMAYQGMASGALYDGTSPLYALTNEWQGAPGKIVALTPGADGIWSETIVHSFCSEAGCTDGGNPSGDPLMDADGNIFGTTYDGGANNGGVAYELMPGAAGAWTETVLYDFCAQPDCADGKEPGRLITDATGTLFGAASGGHGDAGVLFRLAPGGARYAETVLYDFCALDNCADGKFPGGLRLDASGAIFGSTIAGGAHKHGNVFKFDGSLQVLHDFCSERKCGDGYYPAGRTITDAAGNMYGEAIYGGGHPFDGGNYAGVVYEISP